MLTTKKRRGRAGLPSNVDFTGEHIGQIMGGPMTRIHYSKKIVNFH